MSDRYVEVRLAAVVDSGELLGFLPRNEAIGAWESEGLINQGMQKDGSVP
jgi:hypothetical protein